MIYDMTLVEKNEINEKLLSYIPRKSRKYIISLYREYSHICFVMEWEDGFQRCRVADNIAELKEMVLELSYDRNAEF